MPLTTLADVAAAHTNLEPAAIDHLRQLTGQWQLLADLSFADLVLWLPDRHGDGFWAGAQMRPTTAPTATPEDVVGDQMPAPDAGLVGWAYSTGNVCRDDGSHWRGQIPVSIEAIPVRFGDQVVAVIGRTTNLLGIRTPGRLEVTYLRTAGEIAAMICAGSFPDGHEPEGSVSPRVGDGCIRLDPDGTVEFASPNAQSSYRRLGLLRDITDRKLADVTRDLVAGEIDEDLLACAAGRIASEAELETEAATVVIRSLPLTGSSGSLGALILLRDVTELRSRERELLTKDATIREIHHRVKNNLQTVAALLRMQARRISQPEAQIALTESVQRVASIAIVHDTLAQSFDEQVAFDEVADRIGGLICDLATSAGTPLRTVRAGSFGLLPGPAATSLAMVLTELLQNAVEHGAVPSDTDRIDIGAERDGTGLTLTVRDHGPGLAPEFDRCGTGSLGLSIVTTLVESEMAGTVDFDNHPEAGALVTVRLP